MSLSVCIPVYNGSKYLKECLDSIASQTLSDFELLIVDDQSTDRSVEIAENFARSDRRARVVKNQQNLGLVGNWNRCIELSSGNWVKFVFQDDLLRPTALEKLVRLGEDSGRPLVFCMRDFLLEEGIDRVTEDIYLSLPSLKTVFGQTEAPTADQVCAAILRERRNFFGEPSSALVHRKIFQQYGVFNENLIQLCDLEYWQRVGSNEGIAFVEEALNAFRLHVTSTSTANRSFKKFREEYLDDLIILHEHAFHPAFSKLRVHGQMSMPSRDFGAEMIMSAMWLKQLALTRASDPSDPDTKALEGWNEVARAYGRLDSAAPKLFVRFRAMFDRHIGWRLRRLSASEHRAAIERRK